MSFVFVGPKWRAASGSVGFDYGAEEFVLVKVPEDFDLADVPALSKAQLVPEAAASLRIVALDQDEAWRNFGPPVSAFRLVADPLETREPLIKRTVKRRLAPPQRALYTEYADYSVETKLSNIDDETETKDKKKKKKKKKSKTAED